MLSCKFIRETIILLVLPITLIRGTQQSIKPPSFCKRGFQVAALYHECWEQVAVADPFEQLFKTQKVYDGAFMEKYASYMCSKVKPLALRCLRKKVRNCTNSQKLVSIANGSGGACTGNKLNPYFKLHIISKLRPVPRESACFDVSKKPSSCYEEAGEKIKKSGAYADDIPHFHKVADKFFDHLWQCMVNMYKSNGDVCPNWQIPMLLTLQRTAMPALFGMRLNNYQIAKLGLDNQQTDDGASVDGHRDSKDTDCSTSKSGGKMYILLRVLSEKPKKQDGDMLLEVNSASSSHHHLGVTSDDKDDVDVRDFLNEIMAGENYVSM